MLPPHPYISRTTDVIGETKFFTEFPKVEDETNLPLQNHAELLPLPDLWQPATTETSTRSAVTTSPMPLPDDFVPITSTTKQLRTTAETTVTILTPSEIVVKTVTTAAIDPIEKMMEYHQQL